MLYMLCSDSIIRSGANIVARAKTHGLNNLNALIMEFLTSDRPF